MLEQERNKELEIQQQAKTREEQEQQMEKQMASMKLAYNNLDKQREKEEAKLMQTDPKKAQQLERLGMAAGSRSSGITHSAVSDMQIIQQDGISRNGGGAGGSNSYSSQQPSSSMFASRDFFDRNENFYSSNSSKSNSNSNNGRFGGGNNDDDMFRGFGSCKLKATFPAKNRSLPVELIGSFAANKGSEWVVVDNDKFTDETLFSSNGSSTKTQGPSILPIENDFQK